MDKLMLVTGNNLKLLRITISICFIASILFLIFEITFFNSLFLKAYSSRLLFLLICLLIFSFSFIKPNEKIIYLLLHILIISLITSFYVTIFIIPGSILINSQILLLLIFIITLLFEWDVKKHITFVIYFNITIAGSILLFENKLYPISNKLFVMIFIGLICVFSVVGSLINYKWRKTCKQKTEENSFLFNFVPLGICRTDVYGNIITANNYLMKMFNFKEDEKKHKLFDYLMSENLKEHFSNGITKTIELEVKCEIGGGTRYLNVIGDVITDDFFAKSYGFIIQDKTESILAQQQKEMHLEQALLQKNHKLQLLSKINHEVRTPLNAILLFHEMVDDNILKSIEEIKKYSRTVKNSSRYLLNTINNFIDYAKMETGKMDVEIELFNIRDEIEDIIELLKPLAVDKNILLNLVVQSSSLNLVLTDKIKYRQIIINLIANSIKYTNKGSVTISLMNNHVVDNKYILYTIIQDTGVGIPENQLDYIFDPFVSYKEDSTQYSSGLGLAICKEFVQMIGGEIKVESKVGEGSKFTVTIPYECNLSISPNYR